TGLVVVEADALGALLGDDVEDVVRQRRMHRAVGRLPFDAALVDGGVRALRLAGAAVDAFAGDYRRHRRSFFELPASRSRRGMPCSPRGPLGAANRAIFNVFRRSGQIDRSLQHASGATWI